jgi:hypothetical protein
MQEVVEVAARDGVVEGLVPSVEDDLPVGGEQNCNGQPEQQHHDAPPDRRCVDGAEDHARLLQHAGAGRLGQAGAAVAHLTVTARRAAAHEINAA